MVRARRAFLFLGPERPPIGAFRGMKEVMTYKNNWSSAKEFSRKIFLPKEGEP
jgi:hypothetical protein